MAINPYPHRSRPGSAIPSSIPFSSRHAQQAVAYLIEGFSDAVPDAYVLALAALVFQELERRELRPLGLVP